MSELIACRICLNSCGKMYDMFKYHLKSIYEFITSAEFVVSDGTPRYACSFCSTLLMKFAKFRERCNKSQDILAENTLKFNHLSISMLNTIDTKMYEMPQPYEISEVHHMDIYPVKSEYDDNQYYEEPIDNNDDYTKEKIELFNDDKFIPKNEMTNDVINNEVIEYDLLSNEPVSSDEEPLSKKSGKMKKKKEYVEAEDSWLNVDVIQLTKLEQIKEIEDRKQSGNYLHSYYKCEMCYKGFVTEVTYRNHMQRHDPVSGPIVCEICKIRWPEERALRAHMLVTHERKYICKLCNNVSKSIHRAREHQKWHIGVKYVCKVCGVTFSKSTSHFTHVRTRHPSAHKCHECGESFVSGVGLSMHNKKVHRGLGMNLNYECPQCKVKFTNKEALNKHNEHRLSCDDEKLWPCMNCGENFQDEESLKKHSKIHRKTPSNGQQKEDAVICQVCERPFANERTFAVHYQRAHLGQKSRPKGDARRRSDVVCEICGMRCISKTVLRNHQLTHTGEKPHRCAQCHKRFRVLQSLQIHLRTHTGESPFKCSECPKAFKHKAALNRHNRVHTGARPYSCPHCGKCFSQSNSMKLHVRSVHQKLPAPYKNRVKNKIIESA